MGEPGVRRWLVPAMILIGLLLFLGLGRCGSTDSIVGAVPGLGPDRAKNPGSSPEPQTPGSTPGGGGGGSGPTGGGAAGPGTVTTGRGRLLPFPSGIGGRTSLARFSGDRAIGTDVRVQSVVANEGFWIGRNRHNRIWVQLVGPPPESPYTVRRGDRVSFNAPVVAHTRRFARQVGVSRIEGAGMLTAQGQHIAVPKSKLKLTHPSSGP
jgi:hypothetical protein